MALNTKNTERELKIQKTWEFVVKYKKREKKYKKQLLQSQLGVRTGNCYVALLVCCNCMKNNTIKVTAKKARPRRHHLGKSVAS